ncbi:MAG: hypothetical protein QW840_02690 [Candidatus Bathyarchaeia archaeon]
MKIRGCFAEQYAKTVARLSGRIGMLMFVWIARASGKWLNCLKR